MRNPTNYILYKTLGSERSTPTFKSIYGPQSLQSQAITYMVDTFTTSIMYRIITNLAMASLLSIL